MATYVITKGSHSLFQGINPETKGLMYKSYKVGDTIELDEVPEHLMGRVLPTVQVKKVAVNKVENEPEMDWSHISTLSAVDVIEIINGLESAKDVDLLDTAEKEGKNRKGVIEAAAKKYAELTAD